MVKSAIKNGTSFLFTSLVSTLVALFQKNLQMVKIASVQLLSKILLLTAVGIIIVLNLGLQSIFISASVVSLITFIILLHLIRGLATPIRVRFTFDLPYWGTVFHKTWPIAVTTVLNLIYFKADTIILSLYHSQESVGLYGASYRVLEIISTFPHMFMGLVLPVMTTAWIASEHQRVQRIWEKTFGFFAYITLPLVFGALAVGRPLMVFIAGSEFELSGTILKILMLATAAIFFGTLYTYMVLIVERQRQMIKYFLGTAVVALIGYFSLIPAYSYWGAAWVTVLTEALIVVAAWWVVRTATRLTVPWAMIAKLIIASGIMSFLAWLLRDMIHIIPLILVSALVYFVLSIAFRAVTIKDLKQLIKP